MKVGIVSDTHDNLPKLEKAVGLFNKMKVDFLLHAGDYVAPFTILKLRKLKCDWRGVFGNNDGERAGLARASQGRIKEGPLRLKLADRKITVVHDINTIDPRKENADLVVFGHTHKFQVLKKYKLLMLNPGEAGGWLSGKSSAAIVDLKDLSHKFFSL